MIEILNRDRLTIGDMQEFHQALDDAKRFDTDFVRNVAYMVAELGEVLNAFRLIESSENDAAANCSSKQLSPGDDSLGTQEANSAREHVAEELADCLAYVIKLANYAEIDLEQAYIAKMKRNITRSWPSKPPASKS